MIRLFLLLYLCRYQYVYIYVCMYACMYVKKINYFRFCLPLFHISGTGWIVRYNSFCQIHTYIHYCTHILIMRYLMHLHEGGECETRCMYWAGRDIAQLQPQTS